MFGIPTFDLLTDAGKQGFIEYMVNLTRKEIISYTPNYAQASAGVSGYVNQVDFDNHVDRTTSVHGIADTSVLATATDVSTAVSTHSSDTTSVHGIADTSVLATATDVSTAVSTHSSDTTSVHGIADTANLVYTGDARLSDARTPTSHAATHIPGGSDAIDLTKITAIAATLPTLPDVLYPAGALIGIGTVAPYLLYRSTGSAWDQVGGAGGGIEVSDTAPATPSAGDLWYNSSNGRTYIYYDSFWVEVGNTGAVDTIIPAGMIMPTAGSVEPSGWLYCYGQNLSRATYARLFTAVGTTYGAGDGSTTFGMPDLRGRTIAGKDNMGGSTASRLTAAGSGITGTTLGNTGGTETHTLTTAQMPSHTHTQNSHNHGGSTGNVNYHNSTWGPAYLVATGSRGGWPGVSWGIWAEADGYRHTHSIPTETATNQNTGGGGAHQNTQPTIILNYLIKT